MTGKIKWGFLGTSFISQVMADAVINEGQTTLHSVAGRSPESLQEFASKNNFTEVAEGTRVDLIHENIVAEDGRLGVGHGWLACLTNLEHHCQQILQEA